MAERPDIRLTPEEQAEFLRHNRKCALATVDKDGFPHIVAMTFTVRDGIFYMTSFGKAQKVLNARRNPKVGLMIEAGDAYASLKGVMIRGTCEILEGEPVNEVFGWLAEDRGEPRSAGSSRSTPKRVAMKITPAKTFTWDHTKLGGRY